MTPCDTIKKPESYYAPVLSVYLTKLWDIRRLKYSSKHSFTFIAHRSSKTWRTNTCETVIIQETWSTGCIFHTRR